MDPEAFLDLANQVTKLNPFPYFDIAHCAITCFYVREDIGSGEWPDFLMTVQSCQIAPVSSEPFPCYALLMSTVLVGVC